MNKKIFGLLFVLLFCIVGIIGGLMLDDLRIPRPTNPRVTCVWPVLEIPRSIKSWCRDNDVTIGMDIYMRFQFRGRRNTIDRLIDLIAKDDHHLRKKIKSTIIEA